MNNSMRPAGSNAALYLVDEYRRAFSDITSNCQLLLIEAERGQFREVVYALGRIINLARQLSVSVNNIAVAAVQDNLAARLIELCENLSQNLHNPLLSFVGHCDALLDLSTDAADTINFQPLNIAYQQAQRLLKISQQLGRLAEVHKDNLHFEITETHLQASIQALFDAEPAVSEQGVILIVDLEQSRLQPRLERQGYQVICCQDSQTAIDTVQAQWLDLILLDTQLPDCYQLLESLRAINTTRPQQLPILMLSPDGARMEHFLELGAQDYLPREIHPLVLRAKLNNFLDNRRRKNNEIDFLRTITRFTAAAFSVSTGDFDIVPLAELADRDDELGRFAQVFQSMVRVVAQRELNLETIISTRTSELDDTVRQLNDTVRQLEISRQGSQASEKRAVEASQAKSIFLANMSHELRTPLNAILGFVQLMDRSKPRDREDREYLATIMRSGEHLLGLINDILALTRIESEKIPLTEQTFDLHRMLKSLQEVLRGSAVNKGLALVFELDPSMPQFVWGDDAKLRQVLMNMLSNAVRFTERGSIILRASWQDNRAKFEIADTGQGIESQAMSQLFEPFSVSGTNPYESGGRGMGLAVSRKYIRLMGGDIEVSSELGRGTIFRFEIKLLLSEHSSLPHKASKVLRLQPDEPNYRILIVDDKWENRTLLIRILTLVGFEVREAENGKEAVETWASWSPHLIFMDMRMPVMDGYIATMRIRDYEREVRTNSGRVGMAHVPIIALTASTLENNRDSIIGSGCDDFLIKPFTEGLLFEKLTKHLECRFIYEEVAAPLVNRSTGSMQALTITPDQLLSLSNELRNALYKAVALGDIEAAHRVLGKIARQNETLANDLRNMVKSYRFDEVQQLLEISLNENR